MLSSVQEKQEGVYRIEKKNIGSDLEDILFLWFFFLKHLREIMRQHSGAQSAVKERRMGKRGNDNSSVIFPKSVGKSYRYIFHITVYMFLSGKYGK